MSEGGYMKAAVESAIDASRASLVCIDEAYVRNLFCSQELARIVAKGKTAMVPLRFEAMEWPPQGPQHDALKNYNTIPFYLSTNEVRTCPALLGSR